MRSMTEKPLFFDRLRIMPTGERAARAVHVPTTTVAHDWGRPQETSAGDTYRECRRCAVRSHWPAASAGCAGNFLGTVGSPGARLPSSARRRRA